MQGGHHHGALVRAQGDRVFFLADHHLADRHAVDFLERVPKEDERFGPAFVRGHIIGMLVIQGIDLGQFNEPRDVHAVVRVERDAFELLVGDGHKLSLAHLVSPNHVLPFDDPVVKWTVPLVLDRVQALAVEQPEPYVLLLGRGVEFDREGDEPEADVPPPIRSHQKSSRRAG